MMSNHEQWQYGPGDELFHEGDNATHMYILRSGKVQVACQGKDGRTHIVGTRGAGETCGETSCLSNKPRNVTVKCISGEGCEVFCVSREDFLQLVRGSWDVAQDLVAVAERHSKEKERRVNFRRTRDEVAGGDDDDDLWEGQQAAAAAAAAGAHAGSSRGRAAAGWPGGG
jgi:CRP-like cAMP-binding protein